MGYQLAQSDHLLKRADARASCCAHKRPVEAEGPHSALAAFVTVPQYDRTHLQGCVCRPALAGGGCCPTGTIGVAAASTNAHHGGHGWGHGAAIGAGLLLSGASFYFGQRTARLAREAIGHLDRSMGRSFERQAGVIQALRELGPQTPFFPTAKQKLEKAWLSEAYLQRDISRSRSEQSFYAAVPGRLQQTAAVGLALGSMDHLCGHALARATGIALWGALGPALFAIYSGVFAAKNLRSLFCESKTPPEHGVNKSLSPSASAFRTAAADFGRNRFQQNIQASLSWVGSAAASGLSACVAAGWVIFSSGWAPFVLLAANIMTGAWAARTNACSRFATHLPVTPHFDRSRLHSSNRRSQLWQSLKKSDDAVKEAVADIESRRQSFTQQLMRLQEAALKPQCGPESFSVVPKAFDADARLAHSGDHNAIQRLRLDETALVKAAKVIVQTEIELLLEDLDEEREELRDELLEMTQALASQSKISENFDEKNDSDGSQQMASLAWSWPSDALVNQGQKSAAAAQHLDRKGRQLAALRQMVSALDDLTPAIGQLSTKGQHWPSLDVHQQTWSVVRVVLLLSTGTLRDALDDKTFLDLRDTLNLGRKSGTDIPHALNNLDIPDHQVLTLAQKMAPILDYGFMHAVFNPRRIESETDALLALELEPRIATELPDVQTGINLQSTFCGMARDTSQADKATCCG